MKLLFLACLLGFAAADLLQDSEPAIDQSVSAFLHGAAGAGSLAEALGMDDPIIDQLADDIETEFGKTLKETFQEILEKIKDNVDNGKAVGQELLEKVKELRQKLKGLGVDAGDKTKETLKKIREKAKEILKKILERLGLGKRNIDDSMDQMARLQFREIVEKIKEKLLTQENIQKIREYIKKLEDTPLGKELKELVDKLRDTDLKEVLKLLLEHRTGHRDMKLRGETWEKLKDFFKDLKIKITDHTRRFGEWVQSMWGKGLDKLKEKYGAVKAIAMEFIANAKDVSAETAREALEFFRPYKDDLGTLWQQIVDASKEAIGQF